MSFRGTNEQLMNALRAMPIRGGMTGQHVAEAAADEIARLTAQLADDRAGRGAMLEMATEAARSRYKVWQSKGGECLVDDDISACSDIAAAIEDIDPDATAALVEYVRPYVDRAEKSEAELARLRDGLIDVTAHLAAAISLASKGSKKNAASDKMFDQMIKDYEASVKRARALLKGDEK